jgi:site-specific DNA recombinase
VIIVSLRESIDTSTPAGRMFSGMPAVWAEFERDTIVERVTMGIAARAASGIPQGQPKYGRAKATAATG